jgi:hypothetical protein
VKGKEIKPERERRGRGGRIRQLETVTIYSVERGGMTVRLG